MSQFSEFLFFYDFILITAINKIIIKINSWWYYFSPKNKLLKNTLIIGWIIIIFKDLLACLEIANNKNDNKKGDQFI